MSTILTVTTAHHAHAAWCARRHPDGVGCVGKTERIPLAGDAVWGWISEDAGQASIVVDNFPATVELSPVELHRLATRLMSLAAAAASREPIPGVASIARQRRVAGGAA